LDVDERREPGRQHQESRRDRAHKPQWNGDQDAYSDSSKVAAQPTPDSDPAEGKARLVRRERDTGECDQAEDTEHIPDRDRKVEEPLCESQPASQGNREGQRQPDAHQRCQP
jgi:hypothetical protein